MKCAAHILFFVLTLTFLFFPSKAFAQTGVNPYLTPNTNADVPKDMHTFTQNVLLEVISAMDCQIVGIDPLNEGKPCLGLDTKTGKIGYVQNGGAVGFMGNMIAQLYTPPFHATDYFEYMGHNFGLVKPAYAATTAPCVGDIGFCGLQPLAGLWKVFRNICYLIFVVLFVVVGLAIMLRVKIDPRTVMSIENSIPKIIIGLILMTLSFAIAGLLIDLMYVCIYVLFNVFANPNIVPGSAGPDFVTKIVQTQRIYHRENPFEVFSNLVEYKRIVVDSSGGIKDIIVNMFSTPANGLDIITIIKNGLGAFVGYVIGAIALLVIGIAVLVALFRLWFALLTAYVYILIHTVLSPFWIVGELIPESPVNFSGWLREMISSLSSFIVTIAMFLLGRVFLTAFDTTGSAGGVIFVAPLIGNPNQQGGVQPIASLIALGLILMTPAVVTMMKDILKAPKFPYTAAIGQSLAAGAGGPGRAMGALSNYAFGMHYDASGKVEYGHHGMGAGPVGQFARAMGWVH